ncbi:hepatitis A virus cellular receptor 1-like [Hippopotamus amphibius kiboko]|uniref:hepatitis A virus cellular receptor 1-like n=1 Tax=Hippopotamus amphibius kiboko TaxID=575201 RepID=UPI002598A364|nr:hepatitis A virus cellular receptor 1-like [Hippopotamus amphibius kiboko]
MHPWVAILGLILLLTDGVTSYPQVTGVVGQSVRLPCSYGGEVASTCWGRGACSWLLCRNNILWTDGYRVTTRQDRRYSLHGNIDGGDVSLTIENATLSDSGLYCCRVKKRGWFQDVKITLELRIRPAPPTTTTTNITITTTTTTTTTPTTTTTTPTMTTTTPPTTATITPTTTMATTTSTTTIPTTNTTSTPRTTTTPAIRTTTTTTPNTTITTTSTTMVVTTAPMTTRASTSALPMPTPTKNLQPVASLSSPTQTAETQPTTLCERNMTGLPTHSCSTDGNGTVTQSPDALWRENQTPAVLAQGPRMGTRKGVYIGISVTALLLITFLVIIRKRYFCLSNKVELLHVIPLRESHIGALKNAAVNHVRAEDNIYIIDDLH